MKRAGAQCHARRESGIKELRSVILFRRNLNRSRIALLQERNLGKRRCKVLRWRVPAPSFSSSSARIFQLGRRPVSAREVRQNSASSRSMSDQSWIGGLPRRVFVAGAGVGRAGTTRACTNASGASSRPAPSSITLLDCGNGEGRPNLRSNASLIR